MHGWVDPWLDAQMHGWIDGWVVGGWVGGWMCGWMSAFKDLNMLNSKYPCMIHVLIQYSHIIFKFLH